jgi:hypothetical protein
MAARFLRNRINNYYMSTNNQDKEREIIKHILQEKKYDTSIIHMAPKTQTRKTKSGSKWANFTYAGKETNFS